MSRFGGNVSGVVAMALLLMALSGSGPASAYMGNQPGDVEPRIILLDEVATEIVGGPYPAPALAQVHSWGWTGAGAVIAISDTGVDLGVDLANIHADLRGRIVAVIDYAGNGGSDTRGHGTHVAGIAAGSGTIVDEDPAGYRYGLGVAPAASIVVQNTVEDPAAQDPSQGYTRNWHQKVFRDAVTSGASISSNSWCWGGRSGACFTGYAESSAWLDELVRDAVDTVPGSQPVFIVFAAGNDGPGAWSVSSVCEAKNVLCVGASENERLWVPPIETSQYANDRNQVAPFSSRGPGTDYRLKPDIVAPGTWISSALSQVATDPAWCNPPPLRLRQWGDFIDAFYEYCSGTSMAAPHASGGAALFSQYYIDLRGVSPSPALVKAALINSATDMPSSPNPGYTDPVPNFDEGWGRLDLVALLDPAVPRSYEDQPVLLSQGQAATFQVEVPSSYRGPLKVTLVWTDPPAATNPAIPPILVNDLDLTLSELATGRAWIGNTFFSSRTSAVSTGFTPGNPTATSAWERWDTNGDIYDDRNNVENIFIPTPSPGRYIVEVSGRSLLQPPQDFAVVVSGAWDVIPPGIISDLSSAHSAVGEVELTWTAPGDDGSVGTASEYDIRYRINNPVTDTNWGSVDTYAVAGEPRPHPAGTPESFVVMGLTCSPTIQYYFAIKTRDEAGNEAPLSNPNPPGLCAEAELNSLWTSQDPASQRLFFDYDYDDGGGAQTFYIRAPKSPNQAYFNSAAFLMAGSARTFTYWNTFDGGLDADPGSQNIAVQEGNAILEQTGGTVDQQSLATDIQWDIKGFEELAQAFQPDTQGPDPRALKEVELYLDIIAGPPGGDPADPGPLMLTVRIQTNYECPPPPQECDIILGTDSFTFTSPHHGWWPFYFDLSLTVGNTYYLVIDWYEGAPGLLNFEGSVFGDQSNPYPDGNAWVKHWQESWTDDSPRDIAFRTYSVAPGYATSGTFSKTIDRQSNIASARLNVDQTSPTGTSVSTYVWNFNAVPPDWVSLGTGDKVSVDITAYKSSDDRLVVRFDLSGPGTRTPYIHDFSVETDHVPGDVIVYVGTEQIRFYSGPLTTRTVGDDTVPFLRDKLNDYLAANPPGPDGFVWIPIRFEMPTAAGTIRVSNVMMLYCWGP